VVKFPLFSVVSFSDFHSVCLLVLGLAGRLFTFHISLYFNCCYVLVCSVVVYPYVFQHIN
jgi:hypothetical protein